MRKLEVCEKALQNEAGSRIRLTYYITVDEIEDLHGGVKLETYGVGVCADTEEAFARGVTMNAEKASKLVGLLSSGLVTPTAFDDIMEDWLAVS